MTLPPLLVTSLPPRMSRLDTIGEDIGLAYQQNCIDSWHSAGFDPLSINSINEDYPHSVRMIPVWRDTSTMTGRPHVYLEDMLTIAATEAKGRPFVLTNADLVFPPTAGLTDRVKELRPGELIISRRIDIDSPACYDGIPYHCGFDFFAIHPNDVFGLSTEMVFGAPWWDHLFPLIMYIRGCKIYQSEATVLHLKHDERWEWQVWEALGQRFLVEMSINSNNGIYGLRLRKAVERRTGRLISDLIYNIWRRLPKHAAGESIRMLHRVSEANLSFLDEASQHID